MTSTSSIYLLGAYVMEPANYVMCLQIISLVASLAISAAYDATC